MKPIAISCKLTVFLGLVFSAGSASGSIIAGPVTNPSNGHTYYMLSASDWFTSQTEANLLGGQLATIRNADENSFVVAAFLNFGGSPRALWIGLNDAAVEGVFVWASGEPVTYTNWGVGEPNNYDGIEDHVHIVGQPFDLLVPGVWNDTGFNNSNPLRYGLVEVVPEPSTAAVLGLVACVGLGRIRERRAKAIV